MSKKWNIRFLEHARVVASWSKDPSTKVGAVITDQFNRVISIGYNGFARGCDDSPEVYANRERKYLRTVHAEINAILFAKRDLTGCRLYTWPFQPCSRCAAMIINSDIKEIYAPPTPKEISERWGPDLEEANNQFREAGVKLTYLELNP